MTIATMTGGGGLRARAVTRPAMGRRKQVRVAKARWPGVCVQCNVPYSIGSQVVRCAGEGWGWLHVQCFLARRQQQQDSAASPSARPRPGSWL